MTIILNIVRGALIGMAELVPGVSGGTIALVTGVYERVLYAANRFLDSLKLLVKGPSEKRSEAVDRVRSLDWLLLGPLLAGMFLCVVTMAGVMESFVSNQPEVSRALFMGMVLVSISVPLLMIDWTDGRKKIAKGTTAFVLAACATFFLTGLTSAPKEDPNMVMVFCTAAIAICALVLPGVSGSFFLLSVGLYSATMSAVDNRDIGYLAVFALGAATGLILFVRILEKLLIHTRTMTLLVMAGLMFGSLRALWPWQDNDATLLPPSNHVGLCVVMFCAGAALVTAMVLAERHFATKPAGSSGSSR
ncbi:DUF368 domain-containing protein [Corynebacterium sp. 4HC-13]|uniref:DUF368 domain-containing protein n=1 Tax=Corynebacterium anserum TaxID=2684406 RepID=UPI00163A51E5|nr:DUF368 domain-containing protein [Corynebacterium anserum]MBC2680848.1 DUF368 domain-containing protein [Corynebacterium anserum]